MPMMKTIPQEPADAARWAEPQRPPPLDRRGFDRGVRTARSVVARVLALGALAAAAGAWAIIKLR